MIRPIKAISIILVSLSLVSCGGLTDLQNNLPNLSLPEATNKPQDNVTLDPIAEKETLVAKQFKVAVVLPTKYNNPHNYKNTKSITGLATSMVNAIEMARKELNEPRLSILLYETNGTAENVQAAAQNAVNNKVDLVLGPLLAPSVVAMRSVTEPAGVPVIAFSSDKTSVNGGFSYLLSYLIEQNVSSIVNYAMREGHIHYGALTSQSPYGTRVAETFSKEVQDRAGVVTNYVQFDPRQSDFYIRTKSFSEKDVKDGQGGKASYSSFILSDSAPMLMRLMPILEKYDMKLDDYLILGTGIWDDPKILSVAELNGAVYAAPDRKTLGIFNNRFQKSYGYKPSKVASLAYDAISLTVALIRNHNEEAFDIRNITDPNGFSGVGGIFRFKSTGLSERGLSILKINNGAVEEIQSAPDTFIGS